jgi:DNA-binding Xre family transcriptional regulator
MSDRHNQAENLRQLMQRVGINSFKQLRDRAQISVRALSKLRQGEIMSLRYEQVDRLVQVLQISVTDLVAMFGNANVDFAAISGHTVSNQESKTAGSQTLAPHPQIEPPTRSPQPEQLNPHDQLDLDHLKQTIAGLKAEYQHLQSQQVQQEAELRSQFEQEVIQKLESFILQWPTAAYAAQQNAQLPAKNLVPLLRPIENLLKSWGLRRSPRWVQKLSLIPIGISLCRAARSSPVQR